MVGAELVPLWPGSLVLACRVALLDPEAYLRPRPTPWYLLAFIPWPAPRVGQCTRGSLCTCSVPEFPCLSK